MIAPRHAQPDEATAVALLWHAAWHETQAPYVPDALIQSRTMTEFKARVKKMIETGDSLRVAGPQNAPVGMCAIRRGELYQLFVAPAGRGTGVAAILLADAEARLRASGCTWARLDCLDENEQAKRFYSRKGWVPTGVQTATLDTAEGPFKLPCMVFEKELDGDAK